MGKNLDGYPADATVLETFGRNLRARRKAVGLTQEGLSLASGLDRSYIGQVERGERNIALLNITQLARALNIEPRDLFDSCGTEDFPNAPV